VRSVRIAHLGGKSNGVLWLQFADILRFSSGKFPGVREPAPLAGPTLRGRIQTKSYLNKCSHKIMTDHTAAERAADSTINKIEQRKARVGIIGLGYVGLPLALLFTEQKFAVTGFDIDKRKVDTLAQGGSYIYRISPEEIKAANARGFSATSDYAHIEEMDAIIICVPTPLNQYHEPEP